MQATAAQPPAIGLLLAGSLCLLPFLVPYHQPPVLSFHAEWLAAALGTAAALAALTGRSLAIVRLPVRRGGWSRSRCFSPCGRQAATKPIPNSRCLRRFTFSTRY